MMEMMTIMFMFTKIKYLKIMIQNMMFIITFNYLFSMGNLFMDYSNLYMFMYQDKYSSMLILLTMWMSSIMFIIINNKLTMLIYNLMLLISLSLSSTSIIMFYIWFETSLIPLFIIIFWWGNTKERSIASMYMLIYTMLGSLPLMLTIFTMYKTMYSLEWNYLIMFNLKNNSLIMYWNMIVAFLVKIPVFGFHIWLPKAHVEAPVYGSMILASVVLKLGGMGLMRMMMTNIKSSMLFNTYIMTILMMGTLLISFICTIQPDMKSIVAYSSVVHMGIATLSMMTLSKWGFSGSMIMMIGHGLCSSSMFFLVNIIYMRSGSRIMILNKGIMNIEPIISFMWFFICIANMGAPISLNFISELVMINSIMSWSQMSILFLVMINIMSSYFSMQLFMFTTQGNYMYNKMFNIKMMEYHIIILHILPLNLLVLNSWMWNFSY